MNGIVPRPETSIASVSIAAGNGSKIAPQNLGEVVRFAEVMAKGNIALPKHLRDNPGACMAVALQALEWEMSPFAVASKSYSVSDRIAYEAQLIAAVVNTRSGIKGRLRYQFDGDGDAMTCTVTGTLDGADYVYTSPQIGRITPKNSPLWKNDPQQQLGYFSARSWARRYTPEVLLGVYDRDEIEAFGPEAAKDITPRPGLAARLATANGLDAEGFTIKSSARSPADESGGAVLSADPGAAAPQSGDDPSVSPDEAPAVNSRAAGADLDKLLDFASRLVKVIGDDMRPVTDEAKALVGDMEITDEPTLAKARAITAAAVKACGNYGKPDGLPKDDALDLIAGLAGVERGALLKHGEAA